MPDLTPLARISAAIEKLERLKAESTPGLWQYESHVLGLPSNTIFATDMAHVAYLGVGSAQKSDAELIVVLHRSIPVLLTLLKSAEREARQQGDAFKFASCDEPGAMVEVVRLASLILGGES